MRKGDILNFTTETTTYMIRINVVALTFLLVLPTLSMGQISGDLQLQNDYFQRDSAIGAFNTPQFDNLKS